MSDWTAAWNASPTDSDLVGNGDEAIADTRDTIGDRIVKEHFLDMSEVSPQPQQGRHRPGSAVSFAQSSAPTMKPDGSAVLDAIDHGRLWLDTDTNIMYFWKWATSSGAWTECAPAHGMVLLTSGTSWVATHTGPVKVTCIGAGGSGNLSTKVMYGGGAGGISVAVLDIVAGTAYSYSIGAVTNTAGANGGASSITIGATTLNAGGGSGATTSAGGAGGSASGGTLNIVGQNGVGNGTTTEASTTLSGRGGSSLYGQGGDATGDATGYGAGGCLNPYSGTAGCIIIEW